jgi:hypothetical protein
MVVVAGIGRVTVAAMTAERSGEKVAFSLGRALVKARPATWSIEGATMAA